MIVTPTKLSREAWNASVNSLNRAKAAQYTQLDNKLAAIEGQIAKAEDTIALMQEEERTCKVLMNMLEDLVECTRDSLSRSRARNSLHAETRAKIDAIDTRRNL